MMHRWKIAYDIIIVSIEMLKCYIDFYIKCAIAWDARDSTKLRLYIKSKWDVLVWIILSAKNSLRSSNSMSFYENIFILKWIEILGWRD